MFKKLLLSTAVAATMAIAETLPQKGDVKMLDLYLTTKETKVANTFNSIEELMQELQLLAEKTTEGDIAITVHCAPGTYQQKKAILFRPGKVLPVSFVADKPGTVVFDGGTHITKWTPAVCNGKNALCADVPKECITNNSVTQLFINGKRKNNSPYPKDIEGFRSEDEAIKGFQTVDRFPFKDKVFKPEWLKDKGLQGTLIQKWTEQRHTFKSFDEKSNALFFSTNAIQGLQSTSRLFFSNLKEAFTEPGEYYFDAEARKLYYLPEKGETEIDAVILGKFPSILAVGNIDKKQYIENIRFDGITFRYTGGGRPMIGHKFDFQQKGLPQVPNAINWNTINNPEKDVSYDYAPQAAIHLPGIVTLYGAQNCTITNCNFENCGWNGILLCGGCKNIEITGNDFYNLGGGGIYFSGPKAPELTRSNEISNVTITENHIHHCGRFYLSAVGINCANASRILIEHNDIHDLFYTGISVGWVWGYADSATHEVRVGFNHIYDIGQKMLCDMGGVYLLGTQPGTHIYNNLIHDITCRDYGGWGLYTDEGSSYIVIENNICYDCSKESCHQHYGRENIYRYNICAFGKNAGFNVSDGTCTQTGYTSPGENYRYNVSCMNNVILVDDTPFFHSWAKINISEQIYSDNNVFWDISGKYTQPFSSNKITDVFHATFKDWQADKNDLHGIIADPGFVNPQKRDFHLKKDSILHKLDFPNPDITLSTAGRTKK